MPSPLSSLLALSLLVCLTSFSWAVRCHFVFPERATRGQISTVALTAIFGALHLVTLVAHRVEPLHGVAAALLYIASLSLFSSAVKATRGSRLNGCFAADEPLQLIRRGPYRFIRHPFYAAYLLTWFAGAIATGSALLLATCAVMLALYIGVALSEESRFDASGFHDQYEAYRSTTGMFFPAFWKRAHRQGS
jgi:protein-S-isoprenylcysteine O-methyltransferase Ste14